MKYGHRELLSHAFSGVPNCLLFEIDSIWQKQIQPLLANHRSLVDR